MGSGSAGQTYERGCAVELLPASRRSVRIGASVAGTWLVSASEEDGEAADGDAQFKGWWDGNDWTERCRIWNNGAWQDASVPRNAATVD